MKEFSINEFLALRLEDGITNIYIEGKLFEQCKFLLINIPAKSVETISDIQSVDEAATVLDRSMEGKDPYTFDIPPEVEFWAHCSNIQVWYENNYDTRLIHSNLAFPLLKKLTKAGDTVAESVFKGEVAKRISHGYYPVIRYLIEEGYADILSREEFFYALFPSTDQGIKEASFLLYMEKRMNKGYDILEENDIHWVKLDYETRLGTECARDFVLEAKKLAGFSLGCRKLKKLPESLCDMIHLRELYLFDDEILQIPNMIGNLENLEVLEINGNYVSNLPKSLAKLQRLKRLNLSGNKINDINIISKLINLKYLNLEENEISKIFENIGNLENLEYLNLRRNEIIDIPHSIRKLKKLKILFLDYNHIGKIPEELYLLTNLEELYLGNNYLDKIQDGIEQLENLKVLSLGKNNLKEIPKGVEKLKNLKKLYLYNNKIEKKDLFNIFNKDIDIIY